MENSAKMLLKRDILKSVKAVQSQYFNIIDTLRADDLDNLESLKEILKDDELAAKFQLFQENKLKSIRKRILDAGGNLSREMESLLDDYDIGWSNDTEIKGKF